MRHRRHIATAAAACAVVASLALPGLASAQAGGSHATAGKPTAARANVTKRTPADVSYSFNSVKTNGVATDASGPTHRSLRLGGRWLTGRGADGRRHAVELRARSEGVITRSTPLIPGDRGFAVAMTVKINHVVGNDTPNLAQLGYYRDPGQWKVEVLPNSGQVRCRIKGSSGTGLVISKRGIIDGKFHTVVCYRLHGQIGIAVDGHAVRQRVHIGTIASTRQIHIGNKDLKGSSDQVRGVVDYFSIALGAHPVLRATAAAPALH